MIRYAGIVVLVWALGCGGKGDKQEREAAGAHEAAASAEPSGSDDATPAAEPETTATDEAEGADEDIDLAGEGRVVESCEDACTEVAVCWEQVNGGDYRGGGRCVSGCEELDEDHERPHYFDCVRFAEDCAAMLDDC